MNILRCTLYAVLLALVLGVGCGEIDQAIDDSRETIKGLFFWCGILVLFFLLGAHMLESEGGGTVEEELNPKEIVKRCRDLAYEGDVEAQVQLGQYFEKGKGVPEDIAQAYAWYNVAAANGSRKARNAKKRITERLTDEQIVEAQEFSTKIFNRIEDIS